MKKRSPKITQQLNNAHLAIRNAQRNEVIAAALAGRGYGETELADGLTLYNAADIAVDHQDTTEGEQLEASANYKGSRAKARGAFQEMARTCRALWLRQPARLTKIGLDKPMPHADADFLKAGRTLFKAENYDQGMRVQIGKHGYNAQKFTSDLAKIEALDAANQTHESAKADAKQAVKDQNAALRDMDYWLAQFLKIARVALADKPTLLGKLGVLVRSSRTKAQKQAPTKAAETRKKKKQTKLAA